MSSSSSPATMQHDVSDVEKKTVSRALPDAETAIESAKQGIDALTEKIAALETSIKDLEKGVPEVTDQRKAEHKEFL